MPQQNIVFSFHNVSNTFNVGLNNISISKYEKIANFISSNYKKPTVCFDDAYEDIFLNISTLNNSNLNKVIFPITNYIGKRNTWDINFFFNRKNHINSEQLKSLYNQGWIIGSHGHNHISYSTLTDKQILDDLLVSKNILQNLIDIEIDTFTPPFGYIEDKHIDLVIKAGYNKIFLNQCYINKITDFKKLDVIRRINIYSLDTLSSIKNREQENYFQLMLEETIHSCAKATVFFKGL